MRSACVVELLHVTVSDIKILSVCKKCFYGNCIAPTTILRFCVNARHCGPTGTKSGASCEVLCKCQALWSDWN